MRFPTRRRRWAGRGAKLAAMSAAVRVLALLPCLAVTLYAQPPRRHGLSLNDLAKIRRVGDPVLSPNGRWVAYTVRSTDAVTDAATAQIWMSNADGTDALQMTQGAHGADQSQWSPDGRFLSFLSAGAGAETGIQVWLLNRRGGNALQLTHLKQHLVTYRWSPDAKQLLLTIQDRKDGKDDNSTEAKPEKPQPIVLTRYAFKEGGGVYLTTQRDHLYLSDVASGKLTRLLHEPYADEEDDAEWSPDGKQIAFVSQRAQADPERTEDTDIFVTASAADSTPQKLTTFAGVNAGPLAWSPDGRLIAYRQARFPGYSSYTQLQLAVVAAAGGPACVLAAALGRSVGDPVFTADGKALLTEVVDDRNQYLERVPIDGVAPKQITRGEGVVTSISSRRRSTVVEWSNDVTFPELYAMTDEGALRQITHQNDALLKTVRLLPTTDISAHTADGNDVHGLLTMPADYVPGTKAPMLLYIHGGPSSQDAHDFTLSRQIFAGHGYAVLQVNYRGSLGRGHAYSRAIQADWGDKEVIDLLAMVDAAVATGKVDPARLGVGGWSYGAILTDDLIAKTDRFKAASAGAGRANLLGIYGVNAWVLQYDTELGKPWKNPALYIKISYPFFHADRIKTPTLFLGGDRDFNVPLAGSEQMYEALRSVGTPTELVIYPGQTHIFTRPSFIRDRYQRWFNWYDHYLGIKTEATESQPAGEGSSFAQ
jgi:dipeptidyl aminopeptidase/acylaminoacyl peptidase